jgi:hypothetical protein
MRPRTARAAGALLAALVLLPAAARADDIPRPEHPDPLAVREHWANLNGKWDFRFDPQDEGQTAEWFKPAAEGFDRSITVPFPWESKLSGIEDTSGTSKVGWYRRTFQVPDDFPEDEHVWLRFGAVDWQADVWVNGEKVAAHAGGYTPFEADITQVVKRGEDNTVVVRAFDPTDPSLPTGKQVYWYTPTSGIWQTVWLESRPEIYIAGFTILPEINPAQATFRVYDAEMRATPSLELVSDDPTLDLSQKPTYARDRTGVHTVTVPVRDPKPWSPDSPHLYDVTLELKSPDGTVDRVKTYFGLRTIARGKLPGEDFERILLNGKPIFLRGALDQSFNPDGIYTAPSDEFLQDDIKLAKSMGTNFLRIHIKPDEPRRLYWADKLGMLIMEDMPNTWQQNPRARLAWEQTMREAVSRDVNHPAIFAWVDFNETWGLQHPDYRTNEDTQEWVKQMVAATRQLDPTRLVEDNSPCNYDHVEGSDLNSWHFYIDDHREAARHVAEVVEKSHPGSEFNYVPGEQMNSAPLINSEYGSVSAGGGDRDISWGFRDLTTLQRKYDKIQGYIYTELTDIEWEHNGFADYDRTAKVFGYDAFVPGMTPADLQGDDFVGYDGPPAIEAKVGEEIPIELFVSHYSTRTDAPTLRWWITGSNDQGEKVGTQPRTREAQWSPYGVAKQKRLVVKIHEPFVGAVGFELLDKDGKRIAANFENLVVRPEEPQPRVERVDDHTVALRFRPDEFRTAEWSGGYNLIDGKAHGQGSGSFGYRLKLPEAVAKAKPKAVALRAELSAKAGREKVDWAERSNPQDYPQTDQTEWPTSVALEVDGQPFGHADLPDDPADARGVLSHLKAVEHGSFGELVEVGGDLKDDAKAALAGGEPLTLRLVVPADEDEPAGGLAVFGADMGRYPTDPTVLITTEDALPEDLGVDASGGVAVETAASRRMPVLKTGEAGRDGAATWSYTTERPGREWASPGFDAGDWQSGPAGFGTGGTPGIAVNTTWDSPRIWLRTAVELPELGDGDVLTLRLFHDEDAEIFVNGERLLRRGGYVTGYEDIPLSPDQRERFKAGRNVIAVSCRQSGGGQGIDVGLTLMKGGEPAE